MNKLILTSVAMATALTLSACGSRDDQEHDPAAAREAAQQANLFASMEEQMNERMMAAVGTDAGDSWVRKMIEHHQGAINMSRRILDEDPSPEVARMARDTIDKQTREVGELRSLVRDGAPHEASAALFRPAMESMRQAMSEATGADSEKTYLRKMLAHHRGGVALADAALETTLSHAVRAQVMKTRTGQQDDAEMTEAMLRGEPMPPPEETPAPAAAAPPAAAPSPAPARPRPTASPRPQPQASPAPAETADPHAGHTMNDE